jgi:hypothetical protein
LPDNVAVVDVIEDAWPVTIHGEGTIGSCGLQRISMINSKPKVMGVNFFMRDDRYGCDVMIAWVKIIDQGGSSKWADRLNVRTGNLIV